VRLDVANLMLKQTTDDTYLHKTVGKRIDGDKNKCYEKKELTMFLKTWRFITIILTALLLGTTFSHVLELPSKMSYEASLYVTLNRPGGLYQGFGTVGSVIEVTAILSAIVLSFFVRKHRLVFQWTLLGTVCLVVALVIWFVFIAPVNAEIDTWTLNSIPADWTQWRNQWEYTHATRFVIHLIGFSALLISILIETPTNRSRDRVPRNVTQLTNR
jgi:hypothetical protein